MITLDFHGDDYGISPYNCIRFVELMKQGAIDSISIIPNMDYFDEAMEYLREQWKSIEKKPLISVHVNIIDGYSLSNLSSRELTREGNNGKIMNASWGRLLLLSFVPSKKRKMVRGQLSTEIGAQIQRVYDNLPEGCGLRLDSHVHTHMIPIVFDAMMDALEEHHLLDKCEFVRVSREPLGMFLTTEGVMGTFSIINVIKNILLCMLSGRAESRLDTLNISYGMLWGLIMTGMMDVDRVERMMPKMKAFLAKRDTLGKNSYLEILCHPGLVLDSELKEEFGSDDLIAFFSHNRDVEYNMLVNRKK